MSYEENLILRGKLDNISEKYKRHIESLNILKLTLDHPNYIQDHERNEEDAIDSLDNILIDSHNEIVKAYQSTLNSIRISEKCIYRLCDRLHLNSGIFFCNWQRM